MRQKQFKALPLTLLFFYIICMPPTKRKSIEQIHVIQNTNTISTIN